ncbi:ABC transporter substrate-binding protein [Hydrogenophaga sp. BPS33]|uniref:ABC transporter substrate-binding protein n=1 Tax=Hydrogenophaga sp. BPS33 TaxID=2651974 RepID=UPI0013203649|nr:ABC transporter substrate-binding protein [Hydrogenophaga sp. BPS33]QHE84497.1 ABC transporter substrate-binding protein [Hydrogenophaga sp. BPS33]
MTLSKTFQRSAQAVAATIALMGGAAQAQISDDVIRIGVMNDASGPYSGAGGSGSVLGARMAIEDFGGKVNGKSIELVSVDDQNKPDVGLAAARKWIDTDKVDVIVGGSASSIALGVQSFMKEKQKPYLIAGTISSDFTGKACSPMSIQFLVDTYSLPKAGVQLMINKGIKDFFFITVDYAFGAAMQAEATTFIQAAGGRVVGSVKHPLGATDFSSYLLQAQSSGAKGIVILNAGADVSNSLKQAAEFRVTRGGQTLSVFGMTINSVTAMGLDVAQGLNITDPFYWDQNEATRAWSKRFMSRSSGGVPPTFTNSGVYSAVTHYLKAVKEINTDDGPKVIAKMKATRVNDMMTANAPIREDGQVMRAVYPIEIKSPAESKYKYDYYKVGAPIPAEQIFRPLAEGGCDFVTKK